MIASRLRACPAKFFTAVVPAAVLGAFFSGCVLLVPLTDKSNPDPEEARVAAARERYYQVTSPVQRSRGGRSPSAQSMVQRYLKQLADKNGAKRTEAASMLGMMGEKAAPAVPALANALRNDPERFVRRASARALGKIGAPALAAKGALRDATKDRDEYVAHTARLALAKLSKFS